MSLSPSDIQELLRALQDSEWDEAQVTVGDVTISVSRNGATGQPVAATPPTSPPPPVHASAQAARPPAAPSEGAATVATAADETPAAGHVVTSPTVGVVWRSPAPGEPPFVEVGSEVAAGDTLCIVEVMKLMNKITTDVAGTVLEIKAQNNVSVEAGTPLFVIGAK